MAGRRPAYRGVAEGSRHWQDDQSALARAELSVATALLQILVYGAVISAIYAMLAVGFTLIFGVARILNLAHGSFYALGAYLVYSLTAVAHLPLWLACLLAVPLVGAFGVVVERVLVRPLRRSMLAVLLITLAVALMVEQALLLIFG